MNKAVLIPPLLLAACNPQDSRAVVAMDLPVYEGAETNWLDEDLVQLTARVRGAQSQRQALEYVKCVAARTAAGRGYGFARQIRTNIDEKGGVWTADAVYTISPSLPQGLETIDVEVTMQACAENGIPLV
ncbi:MAG: hypothetical protein AB3N13_10840 [Arenibacterium sp.]